MRFFQLILPLFLLIQATRAQTLDLPPRPVNALSGADFATGISSLEQPEREEKIYAQIALGNVPGFLRKLSPVRAQFVHDGETNHVRYYVTPDYLAIGSDTNYFLTPLSPIVAQRLADLAHCSLPTKKMVDDIYAAAEVKLAPSPIPPNPAMATVPVFLQHNALVQSQRQEELVKHPLGALVAGHKKDVVISSKLAAAGGKVAIYGWHKLVGKPIQPLYTGHADFYADYSHGIRLVQLSCAVDDRSRTIPEVLADPILNKLLSDEDVIVPARYPTNFQIRIPKARTTATNSAIKTVTLADFHSAPLDEQTVSYAIQLEVKIHINAPAKLISEKKLKLIFYALPNGNSIEQTIGKKLMPGDDWHFDIQHIGAQTRFLRNALADYNVVVAYLETEKKSWPVWRKEHADLPNLIPQIVDSIKTIFHEFDVSVTLSGHSGGGSFIFGYLNAATQIPGDIERIAFLDSNYAYDEKLGHKEKLIQWLKASDQHYLAVLAYNDAAALLDGKHFVSAEGGTWGRSQAMLNDLAELKFTSAQQGDIKIQSALDGRVKFMLKENPELKIYHTIQVERNGFIQCVLSGTSLEGQGYVYFGDRAYTNWVH